MSPSKIKKRTTTRSTYKLHSTFSEVIEHHTRSALAEIETSE